VVIVVIAMVVWAGLGKLMGQVERPMAGRFGLVTHVVLVGGLGFTVQLVVSSTFVVIPA
jgi:hypothetical protein